LVLAVVLLVVNVLAQPVLLSINLALLVVGEIAAVRLAVGADLLIQIRFLVF